MPEGPEEGEPLSISTRAGGAGGSGLSVSAKLVAAMASGIATTAARVATRWEKAMPAACRGHPSPGMKAG
ncbi:hypothetical protein [Streptomyces albidoflavus]|uniref:hypothetical protein n=1 Tax=Streptomyces albidoflavus TaxID=1886 RepID=UPI0024C9DA30|nr:hypothetical protein CCOS2040_06185 [Streptomyces albidoflavus]